MRAVSLRELTKTFSGVCAVDHVTVDFYAGEIHAVLGENGAGKSTLMHLLSGLHRPDSGEIWLDGQPQMFPSPRAARAAGIAMVHQHFMLVPTLTIAENIFLALPGNACETVKKPDLVRRAADLAVRYGIALEDPNAPVSTLPVGAQQRVEILKALATNARVLILDEPTAVLTPSEVTSLFDSLRKLKQDGYLILLITHKIPEVFAISDRLSVLRQGRLIATKETRSCSPTELASLMVEGSAFSVSFPSPTNLRPAPPQEALSSPVLLLQDISVTTASGEKVLQRISLTLHAGEIIGIAGVDGNGQVELVEVLMGVQTPSEGAFYLKGRLLDNPTPARLRTSGVALIPQDRRREGLALSLSVAENLLLNISLLSNLKPAVTLSPRIVRSLAEECISRFSIVPSTPSRPVAMLSGGNQQRVVIARELSTAPDIVIAVNPGRGLDLGATRYIHQQLRERQANGAGLILISTDLDEILSLSDRVYTLYRGRLLGPVGSTTSREQLGQMMGGIWQASP